jgi:hypothetical protein
MDEAAKRKNTSRITLSLAKFFTSKGIVLDRPFA